MVNAGGSYGNFSSEGLPGISNLFVLNGFDNQDPFLNLNNSGSSNLTLGQGQLAEATVVQNGYNSQYGRAALERSSTIQPSPAATSSMDCSTTTSVEHAAERERMVQ